MVFGFGKGSLELSLKKHNFSPGDTIRGKVSLKLKKVIKAKKLAVVFAGKKRIIQSSISFRRGSRRRSTRTKTVYVHKFELKLDGKKEYSKGEYSFEIAIPNDILQRALRMKGALGTAIKAIQLMEGAVSRIEWYVEAYLDIPMGLDVRKKVQINIT